MLATTADTEFAMTDSDQREVIAFLSDRRSYDPKPDRVEIAQTHGALVFLAGAYAYKIKRAVRFPYMDFSTLEKRHSICRREIEINKPEAPDIYLDVVPVTREADSTLAIGGQGRAIEWAVRMKRFDQDMLLTRLVERNTLDRSLCVALADAISSYHQCAPDVRSSDGAVRLATVLDELVEAFAGSDGIFSDEDVMRFKEGATKQLTRARYCLRARGRWGFIRRCHGDLHLNNVVVLDGRPIIFDAIEFNEDLATIDVLYDLAFLLMDLDVQGRRSDANLILNSYLYRSGRLADVYGLSAMPVFLTCRAGVRAMVNMQRAGQTLADARQDARQHARRYFAVALGYLSPLPARLIAVGGYSGSGKTTLSSALAPRYGAAPGALHLRSDLERKRLFDVNATERLDPELYTAANSARVYGQMLHKARIALKSGHSVVLDATFLNPDDREAAKDLAETLQVPFNGIWLTGNKASLIERVETRKGDVSDATADVVRRQIERGTDPIAWTPIDAAGSPEFVLASARSSLGSYSRGPMPCSSFFRPRETSQRGE